MPRFVQTFYARMNAKSKIKIYNKIIKEGCREYNGAHEFIVNKAKELCSQQEISAEEVRLYLICFGVFICMFCYATCTV